MPCAKFRSVTLARFANTRDANEPEIVRALRGVGASVYLLNQPLDLLVGFRKRTFLLEVKQPTGPRGGTSHSDLNAEQTNFCFLWHGHWAVVRTPMEALEAIGAVSAIAGRDCTG